MKLFFAQILHTKKQQSAKIYSYQQQLNIFVLLLKYLCKLLLVIESYNAESDLKTELPAMATGVRIPPLPN